MSSEYSSWTALQAAASDGNLSLDEGVGKRCAAHCEKFIATLKELRSQVEYLSRVDGLGTLPSGLAVAKKFSLAAVGGDNSMAAALDAHIAEVSAMRDMFLQIEAQYDATEQSNAQELNAIAHELE